MKSRANVHNHQVTLNKIYSVVGIFSFLSQYIIIIFYLVRLHIKYKTYLTYGPHNTILQDNINKIYTEYILCT